MKRQQGISMVMALIMLVVLTMIAISATYSTNSSMRIVGNMQMKDEARVAAQFAIDSLLGNLNNFTAPSNQTVSVDIDNDGNADYSVAVMPAACSFSVAKTGYESELAASAPQDTYWELNAQVTQMSTGAKASITQGVRITLLPYMATAAGC